MKRFVILLVSLIFSIHCSYSQEPNSIDQYHYSRHYENGAIKILLHLNSQTFKSFYENGQLMATGKVDRSKDVSWEDKVDSNKLLAENYSKTGMWNYYNEDGSLNSKGAFVDNEEDGFWFAYHSNGTLRFKGIFSKGLETGEWISYFDNGVISEVNNYNKLGELNGAQKYYNKSGKLSSSDTYLNGKKEGKSFLFFNNEIVQAVYIYKDDELNGVFKLFHPNGVLKYTVEYINDEEEGQAKYFYNNGNIQSTGKYVNGKTEGIWTYYTLNGEIKEKITYKKGKKI